MGWKVRSDKLESVKARVKDRGGRQQVRWEVTQYKIAKALTVRGQRLEDGLDITDFQYLTDEGLFTPNAEFPIIEVMPELKCHKIQLKAIKNHFIPYYSLGIEEFLNTYLKIKYNGHGTWNNFLNGQKTIKYEAFQTLCSVLDFDCHEIGIDTREMPDWKKIETLLWQLNHKTQIKFFQDLARDSQNLVCLKFFQVSGEQIPIFWLLKSLIQPLDDSIQKAAIDFNSQIYSDSRDRLNTIIQGLGLPSKLYKRQNPNAIAKEIHKKMLKDNKTIVLLFYTQNRQNLTELYELFNLLYEPLLEELSQPQAQQKLLMVWIDSQPSFQGESDALDGNDDKDQYQEIPVTSRFNNIDIINWTNLEEVRSFIQRTINKDLSNCQFIDNISEFIWSDSQKGQPEVLLKSVYSLCNLKWETYQGSWRKI